jgi:RNA polymerase sigma factor for flagellar operon FliA
VTRADDDFIRLHTPMVRRIATTIARELNLSRLLDDLVSIGFEALLAARATYDPSRNIPFAGFAYYRVRGAMLDDGVNIDGLSRRTLARILRAGDAAAEELGEERAQRDDSDEPDRITLGFEVLFGKVTGALLCARVAQEEQTPESQLIAELERARVRRAIAALDDRERTLLVALYFHERVLEDVAPEIGLTKSGASRMHVRALGLLRQTLAPPS